VSLQDWLKNNWLVKHRTSAEEIASLLAIVERDLSNSQVAGLSPDWRLIRSKDTVRPGNDPNPPIDREH
jgi:hypothetical protein